MRMTALNTIIVKAININTDNTTELFLLLETLTAAVSNTSAIFQTDEVSKVNLQSTVLSFHCFFLFIIFYSGTLKLQKCCVCMCKQA